MTAASRAFRRAGNRQGGCYWCGLPMARVDPLAGDYRTREHLVPRSRGGSALPGNIVAAHRACNERRDMDTRGKRLWLEPRGEYASLFRHRREALGVAAPPAGTGPHPYTWFAPDELVRRAA